MRAQLEALRRDIEFGQGEASIWRVCFPKQRAEITARFVQQSNEEYGDFLAWCLQFQKAVEEEGSEGRFTLSERAQHEAQLSHLRSWLFQIVERGFFGTSLQAPARRALHECEHDFR